MRQIKALDPTEVDTIGSYLGLARLGQGDGYYLIAWEGEVPLGHADLALTDVDDTLLTWEKTLAGGTVRAP